METFIANVWKKIKLTYLKNPKAHLIQNCSFPKKYKETLSDDMKIQWVQKITLTGNHHQGLFTLMLVIVDGEQYLKVIKPETHLVLRKINTT